MLNCFFWLSGMDGKRKASSDVKVCSKRGKLCGAVDCSTCFARSLAASQRLQEFKAANPDKYPLRIAISSNQKYDWGCSECSHVFSARCSSVQSGQWCPYCSRRKLCGDAKCFNCFSASLASSLHAQEFQAANPDKNPLHIGIWAKEKFDWKCSKCSHVFSARCNNVQQGRWCPYCSRQKLCGKKTCVDCFQKSVASSPRAESFKAANPDKDPLRIAISSQEKFDWECPTCSHVFSAACNHVQTGKWCPYCAGRICGRKECVKCAPPCDTCSKKSYFTLKNSSRACYQCYVASGESRSKIRLEIFFLAELQRISEDEFEFLEPTSWDCAVLPGLPYKPDMMWAFDSLGKLFNTAGACKLSLSHISHIVVLEVLEVGIEQHSKARVVPDAIRENEIRESLAGVIVDFVYAVVAAYNHPNAAPSDKFFSLSKATNAYGVVASRKEAWRERVRLTLEALVSARQRRTGVTKFIGC